MRKTFKKLLMLSVAIAYLLVGCGNAFAIERVSVRPATARAKASENYLFQVKGSSLKFILLDSTDEGYFVLSEKNVATRPFSVDGNPVAYDPDDPNSIAHWLNKDFLESGYFPKAITDNIIQRDYVTEGGGSEVPFSKDYTVNCKIALLSQTEWSKYNARFGYADDTSSAYWVLRTVRDRTGSPLVSATSSPNDGLTVDGKWTSSTGIRPAFYLSKDFFDKVRVNVENTGDAILSLIRNSAEISTLNQMYNANDVFTLTETDIAPMADAVTIVGRGIVGEAINGSYHFISLDTKSEDGTMIQWQKSRTKLIWSDILGADDTTYVPKQNDVGYYVRMKVSPMTGSMAGSSYFSQPLGCQIRAISKPVATNVKFVTEGVIAPGTILDAKYNFSDENRDMRSETGYTWEVSSDKTAVQTVGSSRYYKITNSDAGKFIRVGVVPMKKTNSASGRVTVSGNRVYSDWVSVENLPLVTDINLTVSQDMQITASKTEDGVTFTSVLTENSGDDKSLAANYSVENSDGYEVVCQWQCADAQDGVYTSIASDTTVLDSVFEKSMWVRAKVYTKNAKAVGNPTYSEPINVGLDKAVVSKGEMSLTQQVTSGKTYEVWISNDTISNCYAYSFMLDGASDSKVLSDKYLINKMNQADKTYVIGTLLSGAASGGYSFKAAEITAGADGVITISDALVTSQGKGVSKAKVFIVAK